MPPRAPRKIFPSRRGGGVQTTGGKKPEPRQRYRIRRQQNSKKPPNRPSPPTKKVDFYKKIRPPETITEGKRCGPLLRNYLPQRGPHQQSFDHKGKELPQKRKKKGNEATEEGRTLSNEPPSATFNATSTKASSPLCHLIKEKRKAN